MAAAASSPSSSRPSPLARSPLFTPIPEMDREEEEEAAADSELEPGPEKHHLTPLPEKSPARKKGNRQLSVLCTDCRPSSRDRHKTSIVPLQDHQQNYGTSPNPRTLLHSLILTLTRKSPTPASASASASASTSAAAAGTTDYKLVAEELSRKLVHVTRKRDEAMLEASRLKHAVSDLEVKLNRLESYCLDLKSSLDSRSLGPTPVAASGHDPFPAAATAARSAVRALTKSISVHVRPSRIASAVKLPIQDTTTLLTCIESVLNRVFYRDFEKPTEEESKILDPMARCETNRRNYEVIKGLSWDEVLSKGTRHYSEGLSRFCDEKMGEIVGVLGWARAWPESLLQAFFGAAKGVWVVGLLGRCVYPGVSVMRVERGVGFDGRFMEDVGVGMSMGVGAPVSVRAMVAPGFYLGGGPIKSKVVCGYGETCKQ